MGNPYKQLNLAERYQVQSLCELDFSAHRIGKRIQRSNKTISRELKRCPPNEYSADAAHLDSLQKRKGIEAGAHFTPNHVDVDERPDHMDLKVGVGHWEGDTVYGQDGYLVTLTEGVSKLLLTVRVKNKTKKLLANAIIKMLQTYKMTGESIIFDNGGEFAGHEKGARIRL